MSLEEFIYRYNLATTETIKSNDKLYSQDTNIPIDYSQSISLFDLISLFNNTYLNFLKEYNEILPLDILGKEAYYTHCYAENDACIIDFIVKEPSNEVFHKVNGYVTKLDAKGNAIVIPQTKSYEDNKKWCNVEIIQYTNKEVSCFTDNGLIKKGEKREIYISDEITTAHINLVKKYKDFLYSFFELENKFIFGNGTTVMFSKITGTLPNNLNSFKITFGNAFFNCADEIEITVILKEKLEIDYSQSTIVLDTVSSEYLTDKKEIINTLLKKIYISTNRLPNFFSQEKNLYRIRKKVD